VTYGRDPDEYYDDWDIEAGDAEEPTPFCLEPENSGESERCLGITYDYLGKSQMNRLKESKILEGAVMYDSRAYRKAEENWLGSNFPVA